MNEEIPGSAAPQQEPTSTPDTGSQPSGSVETPPDRRSAIADALEKAESAQSSPDEGAGQKAGEKGSAEPRQAPAKPDGRQRGPDGKFVATPPQDDTGQKEPPRSRKYPSSWKPDLQPIWQKLDADPEAQKILDAIEERESQYHKGLEPYKQSAQAWQQFGQMIAPYSGHLQQAGINPIQAAAHLLRMDSMLRTSTPEQRRQLFQQMAGEYGVAFGEGGEPQDVNPQIIALQQQLAQTQHGFQQFMQNQQMQEFRSAQAEIDSFAKTHEYLDVLRPRMAKLLKSGEAQGLEDAYESAKWLEPEIRAKVLAKQNEEAVAKRKAEEAQRANAARSAAVQVKGAPPGGAAVKPAANRDRREVIREAMNDLT